jgi:hypothetical protein
MLQQINDDPNRSDDDRRKGEAKHPEQASNRLRAQP